MHEHQSKSTGRRNKLLVATLLLLALSISLYSRAAGPPRTFTDEELFDMGLSAYNEHAWVNAAVYLYAYVQRNPRALSDPTHAQQVETAYGYCVRQINQAVSERDQLKAQLDALSQPGTGLGRTTSGITVPPPALNKPQQRTRTSDMNTKRCDIYSRIAIAQNELNLKHNCGFGGNRWQSDFDHHFNWCIGTSDSSPDFETSERQKLLNQCADAPSRNMIRGNIVRP
jgi:hypothetical protein